MYSRSVYSVGQILTAANVNQIESNIATVRACHIGSAAPADPEPGILWLDTSTNGAWRLRIRDDAGAWIDLFTINNDDNVAAPAGETAGERFGEARQTNLDATASEFVGPVVDDRNMLINGSFQVWQRGTNFTASASQRKLADRWGYVKGNQSNGVIGFSRENANLPPDSAGYALRADIEAVETNVDSDDLHILVSSIEGHHFRRARWGSNRALPIAISFWVYATKPGVYTVACRNAARGRSYLAEYTVAEGSTWQRVALTVPGDAAGAWERTGAEGLVLSFCLMSGNARKAQPDQWTPGNYVASVNQVNMLDTTQNDFLLAMVQVELGPAATPFSERPMPVEQQLCRRYFWKTFPIDVTPGQTAGSFGAVTMIGASGDGKVREMLRFPVTMRGTPTITFFNPSAANANARNLTDAQDRAVGASRISGDSVLISSAGTDSTDVGDEIAVHVTADADYLPA